LRNFSMARGGFWRGWVGGGVGGGGGLPAKVGMGGFYWCCGEERRFFVLRGWKTQEKVVILIFNREMGG
jgi:hypothetical protein